MLDWCADLNDQHDGAKAEFALLASKLAPDHACLDGLTFNRSVEAALCHRFLPSRFQAVVATGPENYGELEYANGGLPQFILNLSEPRIVIPHRLMWSTNFGTSKVQNADAVDAILDALDFETDVDWIAEYLIGLHCLDAHIPENKLQLVNDWHDVNWTPDWGNYHPFLVVELLNALIGE